MIDTNTKAPKNATYDEEMSEENQEESEAS